MSNIPETIPEVNDETADKPTTPRMGTTIDLSDVSKAPTANGLNETASTPLEIGREDSLLALSLSFQKFNKTLGEDAEDEESGSESDGSDSESDSDSTEALDRTEQPRSNAEKRPPHVRSVWAVPLRIRTKDTKKREMFDAAMFNLTFLLKSRRMNKSKQNYAQNHLDTLRIGTLIVNQMIGYRMLPRNVLLQQQRQHAYRNLGNSSEAEIKLIKSASTPTDWSTSQYYNTVTRKSRLVNLLPKETMMLGSAPNGRNIGGKDDKEYEGPGYFLVMSGEVNIRRVFHGDPRRQHHKNDHHFHCDKPIKCRDHIFRKGSQFFTLDSLPYLINGQAIHHVSPEDGSTMPLVYVKAVTPSQILRIPLEVLRAPKRRSKGMHNKMQLLRGHSAFDLMSDDVVKSFARRLTKVVVRRGGELFKQGGKAKAMYVVENGTCFMTYNQNAEASIARKRAEAAAKLIVPRKKSDKTLKVKMTIARQQTEKAKEDKKDKKKNSIKKAKSKAEKKASATHSTNDKEAIDEYSTEPKRHNYHKSMLGDKKDLMITRINRGQWVGDVGLLLREEHMCTVIVTTQMCTLWMFKPPSAFFQRNGIFSVFEGSKGEDITDLFDRLKLLSKEKRLWRFRRIQQLQLQEKQLQEIQEMGQRRRAKKSSVSASEPIASSLSADTMADTPGKRAKKSSVSASGPIASSLSADTMADTRASVNMKFVPDITEPQSSRAPEDSAPLHLAFNDTPIDNNSKKSPGRNSARTSRSQSARSKRRRKSKRKSKSLPKPSPRRQLRHGTMTVPQFETDANWAARATFILANLSSYNYDVPPTLLGSLLSDFNTGSAYLHYPQQKLAELLENHLEHGSARRTKALSTRKRLTFRDVISFEENVEDEPATTRLAAPPLSLVTKPGKYKKSKYPRIHNSAATDDPARLRKNFSSSNQVLLPNYSPQNKQRSSQRHHLLRPRSVESRGTVDSLRQSLGPKIKNLTGDIGPKKGGIREFSWDRRQKKSPPRARTSYKMTKNHNTL